MKERWKKVSGFGDIYFISSNGRVFVETCKRFLSNGRSRIFGERYLSSNPKKGYPWVILCHPETRMRRNVPIHILVAEEFLGKYPTPEYEVNHKDGNKKNSSVSNLEWVTHKDNCLHAYRIGLRDKRCVFLTLAGKRLKVIEWATILNVPPQTLYTRVSKGYSDEEVLDVTGKLVRAKASIKLSKSKKENAPKYKDGLSAIQWAHKLKISRAAFLWRIIHYTEEYKIYNEGTWPRSGPA